MLSWRSPGDPQSGGAETVTQEVLSRLAAGGHDVTWLGARYQGSEAEATVDGIRVVRLGRQWSVHARAWRWLRRRIDDFDMVVDQVNTLPFLTPLYVPAERRRLLIFQTAREYWWRQTRGLFRLIAPLGYAAEPWYLRVYRGTRAITISDSTRDELAALGLGPDMIAVIPMAITFDRLPSLQDKHAPFRVIVIGRLTPAKYVEDGVAAFARLAAHAPDASLDIVGTGEPEYRARLERIIWQAGLTDRVTFHGPVTEAAKRSLLEAAHVHLFTSHREGWGLTVTEAAACGTPTVGYDAPGVRDSVRDPRLLSPLRSGPDGLAARLITLHNDSSLYADVRTAAWSSAAEATYDVTTDAFLEALHA